MRIKNCIDKNIILSKDDIERLKKAYKNNEISLEYIFFDVKSIMLNESVSKEKAIKRILTIIG